MSDKKTEEQLVADYLKAKESLARHRGDKLPIGVECVVSCGARYTGPGVTVEQGDCPPHLVPVLVSSGNIWWYPIECVTPIEQHPPHHPTRQKN
jgi:hypothetical protein